MSFCEIIMCRYVSGSIESSDSIRLNASRDIP